MTRKKILLVDDSETTLMLEQMALSKTDYTLMTAKDGREAVEKARQEVPDLILMDVVMPRMTGLEACKALREDEKTRGLPIILVTTKGQEHDVDAGFRYGCSDYLTKPINDIELLAMLKSYLGE